MQDRISQNRGNLLHRTAGPYVGVKAEETVWVQERGPPPAPLS